MKQAELDRWLFEVYRKLQELEEKIKELSPTV
jgi:hypothetical protein